MPDEPNNFPAASPEQRLQENLAGIRKRVQDACARAGRPSDAVTLIAVSKTHTVAAIRALFDAGQREFGESYVQEWQEKTAQLRDPKYSAIRWHFIGHLQSNKAKFVSQEIALIHSIGRKSVLKSLQKSASAPVDVLVQVNVGNQPSKGGVAPDGVIPFLETTLAYPDIRVCGLMCIPPYVDDPEDNRGYFRQMRELFERASHWLSAHQPAEVGARFRYLSMGMSGDFEVAIEEGATHIRVGTALFGARDYDR